MTAVMTWDTTILISLTKRSGQQIKINEKLEYQGLDNHFLALTYLSHLYILNKQWNPKIVVKSK